MTTNKLRAQIMMRDANAMDRAERMLDKGIPLKESFGLANAAVAALINGCGPMTRRKAIGIVTRVAKICQNKDDIPDLVRRMNQNQQISNDKYFEASEALQQLATLTFYPTGDRRDKVMFNDVLRLGGFVSELTDPRKETDVPGYDKEFLENCKMAFVNIVNKSMDLEEAMHSVNKLTPSIDDSNKPNYALRYCVDALSLFNGEDVKKVLERASKSTDAITSNNASSNLAKIQEREVSFFESEIRHSVDMLENSDEIEARVAEKQLEAFIKRDPVILCELDKLDDQRTKALDEKALEAFACLLSKEDEPDNGRSIRAEMHLADSKAPNTEKKLTEIQNEKPRDFKLVSAINRILHQRKVSEGTAAPIKMPPPVPAAAKAKNRARKRRFY